MNIKKVLTNFFQEQQKNQPNYQLQRKNAIRLRRRQKSQIFQQANKQPKMYRFFKPCNQEANASAMKYVESHHPCIKERVIRILSNHRQGNNLNKHETLMAQTAKNQVFFRKGHNIHKQSYSEQGMLRPLFHENQRNYAGNYETLQNQRYLPHEKTINRDEESNKQANQVQKLDSVQSWHQRPQQIKPKEETHENEIEYLLYSMVIRYQ